MLRYLRLALWIAAPLMLLSLAGCETYDTTMTEEETNGYHSDESPSEMATEPYIERDTGIDQPQP
jgi:hypothetical protein